MTNTTPKLPWYQYSLRTLMVFVTLCAMACSWFATKMLTAKRQRDAVHSILEHTACEVAYDGDVRDVFEPDLAVIESAFTGKTLVPQSIPWTERFLGKDFMRRAVSVGTPLAKVDEIVPHLASLPYLRKVRILMPDNGHDEELDAAIKRINREVPGIDVHGVVFDFTLDAGEFSQNDNTPDTKHEG